MPVSERNVPQAQPTTIPCRTCTDFKSWAKEQRTMMSGTGSAPVAGSPESVHIGAQQKSHDSSNSSTTNKGQEYGCPYDKDDLGRSTWGLLHTMAAHYPQQPSSTQITEMSSFVSILSRFYPCDICAKDFQSEIKVEPIQANSQEALSQWLCRMHNKVNVKLGKPVFDCSVVNQRWRDGWLDGSCD